MKTKTTYSVIITICLVVGFFLFNSFKPETSAAKYLTVKVVEYNDMAAQSFVAIVDETGKTEEILFDKFKIDNITPNTVKVTEVLNDVSKRGYELVTSCSKVWGNTLLIDTYTFVKK
jgi:hypothetical protein